MPRSVYRASGLIQVLHALWQSSGGACVAQTNISYIQYAPICKKRSRVWGEIAPKNRFKPLTRLKKKLFPEFFSRATARTPGEVFPVGDGRVIAFARVLLSAVRVVNEGGAVFVGAIELASPGNKDRVEERRAFAAKCASYLFEGVSLVVLDVVTSRQGNLHNEIIDLMQCDSVFHFGREESLYAVGYRPVRSDSADVVDMWPLELFLGQPLPTLPL